MKPSLFAAILIFAIFLNRPLPARAQDFPSIWNTVSRNSDALAAADQSVLAAQESKRMAQRHWLPRIYVTASSYQTDDPTRSFMGLLEQRSVQTTDFTPSQLNQPTSATYSQASLGLELPLFEGGASVAAANAQKQLWISEKNKAAQTRNNQYADSARMYGSYMCLHEQKNELEMLNNEVNKIVRSYKIGSRANPVGYSGLLGLKTLSHRIQGMLSSNAAQRSSIENMFRTVGVTKIDPVSKFDLSQFLSVHLPDDTSTGTPYQILSAQAESQAARKSTQMKRAQLLPRVSLFAENSYFQGDRDSGTSTTAGVSLQWSLFDPKTFGSGSEAHHKAESAEARSRSLEKINQAERQSTQQTSKSLREGLAHMDENQKLLTEQTQVAQSLFRNGTINALQLVEVLSRRADLVASRTEAQLQLLQSEATRVLKYQFKIPLKNGDAP